LLERSRVRLLAADDIHLTLVPPWQESSISRATETLRRAVVDFGPFTLEVQHVGYGPDPRRPRLLSADCAAIGELEALRTALLAAYEQADERPCRPNLTLARIRGSGRAIARQHPIDRPVEFRQLAGSVELFRSRSRGEDGYQVLVSASLGKTGEPGSDGLPPAAPDNKI